MAEDLIIASKEEGKEAQYKVMLPQIESIVNGETDFIANMANIMAILKATFNHLWVGVYFVKAEELVLGPFQGPIACTRIQKGKGVCGTAWKDGQSIIVGDVDTFPGHIRCSSLAKSEIVIPMIRGNEVLGVLDVDHSFVNHFDNTDLQYLEMIVSILI